MLSKREPFYGASAGVWSIIEAGSQDGFVSAISFSNVFYLVRRHADAATALQVLRLIRSVFQPVAVDAEVIDGSLGLGAADFEDSIQLECALRCGATYLITRDARGFSSSAITVLRPDELLAVLGVGAHE